MFTFTAKKILIEQDVKVRQRDLMMIKKTEAEGVRRCGGRGEKDTRWRRRGRGKKGAASVIHSNVLRRREACESTGTSDTDVKCKKKVQPSGFF